MLSPSAPAVLSLNCVMRRSSPMYVMVLRIHISSRVRRHVALHEDDGALRVDAGSEEEVREVDRVAPQLRPHLAHGDGVQVDDAVDAVVGLLHGDPVADRAEVVAEVQRARRLDAAEHARLAHGRGRHVGGGGGVGCLAHGRGVYPSRG